MAVAQHAHVVMPPQPLRTPMAHACECLISPGERHTDLGRITHCQEQSQGNVESCASGFPERKQKTAAGILDGPGTRLRCAIVCQQGH